MIAEIGNACLLMRTRLISRVITGIYDRAEIGRDQHLDRSTLTRHLKMALSEGWAEESRHGADGRSRPILLTRTGTDLLRKAEPACRAAEVQAKALLGEDGVTAVMNIASRIVDPETISQ
jgi:DNA-binding MarR family transcriptional regulator